jgi:hypothetical protein
MKELQPQMRKTQISVISKKQMTPDQQASFLTATDALLIELIHKLDRRIQGESDGTAEDEVAQ